MAAPRGVPHAGRTHAKKARALVPTQARTLNHSLLSFLSLPASVLRAYKASSRRSVGGGGVGGENMPPSPFVAKAVEATAAGPPPPPAAAPPRRLQPANPFLRSAPPPPPPASVSASAAAAAASAAAAVDVAEARRTAAAVALAAAAAGANCAGGGGAQPRRPSFIGRVLLPPAAEDAPAAPVPAPVPTAVPSPAPFAAAVAAPSALRPRPGRLAALRGAAAASPPPHPPPPGRKRKAPPPRQAPGTGEEEGGQAARPAQACRPRPRRVAAAPAAAAAAASPPPCTPPPPPDTVPDSPEGPPPPVADAGPGPGPSSDAAAAAPPVSRLAPRPTAAAAAAAEAAAFMGVAKPPKAQRGKRAAAASTGGVGPGGGNFVRINMKGGTKKPYHSSRSAAAAARGRRRGGGRGGGGSRFGGPTLLPQAGDGADFLDGARGPRAGQSGRCFKCGGSGHWAKDCGGLLADGTAADEVAAGEAAAAAAREAGGDPAAAAAAAAAAARPPPPPSLVDTLPPAPAPLDDPTDASAVEAAVSAAHGGRIAAFRGRQAEVVGALMAGRSVLAVLPTGAGKSLCYTAAALARAGTVLVVTPLLALARDQLAHLPPGLPAAALDGAMPRPAARGVLAALASGALRVLFVAPERLASPSFLAAIARMPRAAEGQEPSSSLPRNPLPLVCVDEAHCLDEWGHTFRPAYFRLGRILRERLRPAAVLALTATATVRTRAAIAGALGIPYPDGAIVDAGVRPNLRLAAVTSSGGVDGGGARNALLRLLRPGGALAGCRRAIVYVPFQAAAESLAGGLSAAGVAAVCYHAGRAHAAREAAHAAFVAGAARVLVATVAYGMGVDVPGVDAVLHAALPRSVEEYVQQVGRGGRDCSPPAAAAGRPGAGRPAAGGPGAPDAPPPARPPPPPEARCVALVDDADYRRLRSLTEADGVTPAGVGRLLAAIFGGEAEEGGGEARRRRPERSRRRAAPLPPPPPPLLHPRSRPTTTASWTWPLWPWPWTPRPRWWRPCWPILKTWAAAERAAAPSLNPRSSPCTRPSARASGSPSTGPPRKRSPPPTPSCPPSWTPRVSPDGGCTRGRRRPWRPPWGARLRTRCRLWRGWPPGASAAWTRTRGRAGPPLAAPLSA